VWGRLGQRLPRGGRGAAARGRAARQGAISKRPAHPQNPTLPPAGDSAKDAEKARDRVLEAFARAGACGMPVSGGLASLCDAASDFAEIDAFNPGASLVVGASRAEAVALPSGRGPLQPPACRGPGEACDGAVARCCGWGPTECDLRPGAPTYGTCKSRTGATGYTCAKQGAECKASWQCCGQLKCAAAPGAPAAPSAPRTCTAAPESALLSVNVTVPAGGGGGGRYDPAVQRGLLSAVRYWLLHEGAGAADVRVAGYLPLASPGDAAWRADPTYRFDLVIGAATRAALDHALAQALSVLGGGGGGGGGEAGASGAGQAGASGAALCGVGLPSQGPLDTLCTLAEVRGRGEVLSGLAGSTGAWRRGGRPHVCHGLP
jgi:hypothetical protein